MAVSPHSQTASPTIIVRMLALPALLASRRTMRELAATIAAEARVLLQADTVEALTLDQTNRYLVPLGADPEPIDPAAQPIALYSAQGGRNSENVDAYAAFTGHLVEVSDVYGFSGHDFSAIHAFDRRRGQRSGVLLSFPLRNHDSITLGVVRAIYRARAVDPPSLLPDWLRGCIEAFATMSAIAITGLKLLDEKQLLIRRLGRSNDTLAAENERLRQQVEARTPLRDVIGNSQAMQDVYQLVARTLDSTVTVLLLGETGTGKEVMAHAIHKNGVRRDKPFVVQNCAAVPEQLLESELFGHRRGAFTGAVENKPGLFQAADSGTLFLDEIGDMPIGLQSKLLRVLQDSEVRPVGETRSRKVDVRIIAATHVDLREKVRQGQFREDLFYRLCIFPITLPPLRERRSDILLLADHFLTQAAKSYGRAKPGLSAEAADLLERHDFPGNVRELKNAVERALLLADESEPIRPRHLPPEIAQRIDNEPVARVGPMAPVEGDLKTILQRYESMVLAALLEDHGWNQTRTAQELGISRRSLVEKIQRYAIRRSTEPPASDRRVG